MTLREWQRYYLANGVRNPDRKAVLMNPDNKPPTLEEQMESQADLINPTVRNRDPRNRREIEVAMKQWLAQMQLMLNERFGKDMTVVLLAMAPVGQQSHISWISNGKFPTVKAMLDQLNERVKTLDERRIHLPHEHFGG